jgi:Ca2+-transporting ATPase
LSLFPVFFSDAPLLLFPVHVVFMELIIDPACSIIFEAEKEEPNVMSRPPRGLGEKFFGFRNIFLSCSQGLAILLTVLAIYIFGLKLGYSADGVRAMSFVALITANIMTIMTNRSWTNNVFKIIKTPNTSVKWVVGSTVVFLAAVLFNPFLRDLFQFEALSWIEILISAVAGCLTILWFEIYKTVKRVRLQRK